MDKDNNNNKKPIQLIRNELKYIIFITLFVSGIIFNYLSIASENEATMSVVEANTYRITVIENARAEAWNKYYNSCEKQLEYMREMQGDIIKIKTKLGIEN